MSSFLARLLFLILVLAAFCLLLFLAGIISGVVPVQETP
jgi:hypothetical protein